jgi:hypothetical protein
MQQAHAIAQSASAMGSRHEARRGRLHGWLAALLRAWRAEPPRRPDAIGLEGIDEMLLRDMGFEPRRHRPWAATERDFLPLHP